MTAVDFEITLIHGTFATHAPWTRPHSTLRQAVKAGLDGRVRFTVLSWDGLNDENSRVAAAAELVSRLEEAVEAAPSAAHSIIAHSHGGNIALRAAGNPALAGKLTSVGEVCT